METADVQNEVVTGTHLGGQVGHVSGEEGDPQAGLRGPLPGRRDRPGLQIDAGHLPAPGSQLEGMHAATAAEIQGAAPGPGRVLLAVEKLLELALAVAPGPLPRCEAEPIGECV